MRVTILEAQRLGPSRIGVRFNSQFGEAAVQWASEPPEVCGAYDVEFTISDRVEWDRAGFVVGDRAPSIAMTEGGVQFCGTIDDVQDDGVVALRLGDSLILLESVGEPPPVGSKVCITVTEVELYRYET